MKKFEANSFAAPPPRRFMPCNRVAGSDRAAGTEFLPGCRIVRSFTGNDYPECRIEESGFLLLDFGEELSGGVRIVTGDDGPECRIRLRFGESISEACGSPNPDHAIHDIELPLRPYTSLDFGDTGFRFVRIDAVRGEARLHNCIAVAAAGEPEQHGGFRSSDALLDRIFDTCVRTVRLTIQDHILDGVKRDRLVWAGDLHPQIAVMLRLYGGIPEIPGTLTLLREHTRADRFVNRHPEYVLWYLLTLRDYWFYTGDDDTLTAGAEFIAAKTEEFAGRIAPNGAEQLPAPRFLDWPSSGNETAIHAGLQGLMLLAMRAGSEMLRKLGRDDAAPRRAETLLARHAPDPGMSKAAAALEMLAGLGDHSGVLECDPFRGIGTFMGYYLLLAKTPPRALELVLAYWGAMLKLGATTFWEDFNLDWVPGATGIDEFPVPGRPDIHADFGAYCYMGLRHSLCHGWAAGPAAWCSQKILGIAPLLPGFRRVRIAPDLCGLDYAEGAVATPRGTLRVRLERGKAPDISAPPGVEVEQVSTSDTGLI